MIRPIQPSFEVSKGSVNMARNIWICLMTVIFQRCFRIAPPAIRTYSRTFFHMCHKKILYRFFISLFSHAQTKSTRLFTRYSTYIDKGRNFNSTKNQRFRGTSRYSSSTYSFDRSAYNSFISFYSPMQRRPCIVNHRLTKSMQNKPSRFVSTPHLSLQLLSAHPWCVRGNQISRPKPILNGKMSSMHDRPCCWIELVPTLLTFIKVAFSNPPSLLTRAVGAMKSFWPATLPEVLPASLL